MTAYRSWGLPGPFVHQALPPEALGELAGAGAPYVLAYGNGRSYGDACVNDGHALIPMRGRARCLGFDDATGILECEAGMLLADIVRDLLPRGWFLPVSPGTRFVTVGGAVANDVHGKNHHAAGSFGDHVIDLRLRRGDGTRVRCSPDAEAGLFRATIGGLGLTGLVESVRLQLRHVETGWMSVTTRRFRTFDEFFAVNAWAEPRFEYTVAWIDCAWGRGTDLRGVYFAGNHAARERLAAAPAAVARDPWPAPPVQRRVPFVLPFSLVNELTLRAFNGVYWLNARDGDDELESIYRFFYPLDAVEDWNRIYGRRGYYARRPASCRSADPARRWRWISPTAGPPRSRFSANSTRSSRRPEARSIWRRMRACHRRCSATRTLRSIGSRSTKTHVFLRRSGAG
jgi:FAD/FMN-containing dehydrogenase